MGLKREGTVLLKKETRHSLCLCAATRKNNRIGSAPFRQASNNARGDQTAAPFNILSSGIRRLTNLSEEPSASIFRARLKTYAAGFVYYKIFIGFLRLAFKDHLNEARNCVEHYQFSNQLTN
jgi:hypothetical protein